LDGCEQILRGEFNHFPEQSLYMVGSINEVKLGDDKLDDNKLNEENQMVSAGTQ
jgi:F0F1-type ATP synthase beta subunit